MQRRKFLIGLGGTAIGGGALMGSGAFTTGTLEDRDVNIDVVHDAEGALTLLDMMWDSEMTGYTGDGRYYIDFEAGSAEGANVGGDFQLGLRTNELARNQHLGLDNGHPDNRDLWEEFAAEYPDIAGQYPDLGWWFPAAFALMNRATQTYDLTVEYDAEDPGGSMLKIYAFNGGWDAYDYGTGSEVSTGSPGGNSEPVLTVDSDNPTASWTLGADEDRAFDPEKRIFFTVRVDSTDPDASPADDLSGTLTITAD